MPHPSDERAVSAQYNTTINNTINNILTINNFIFPVGSAEEVAYVVENREELIPKILSASGGYQMIPSQYVRVVWCNPKHIRTGSVTLLNASKCTILAAMPAGAEVLSAPADFVRLVHIAGHQARRALENVMTTTNSESLDVRVKDYKQWLEFGNRGPPSVVLEDNRAAMMNLLAIDNPEYRSHKKANILRQEV